VCAPRKITFAVESKRSASGLQLVKSSYGDEGRVTNRPPIPQEKNMSLETKFDLKTETVDNLQTLIRYNLDSYDGYLQCAEVIDSPHLASLFRDLAHERSAMATELQNYVEWNHEEAVEDGSVSAAIHRLWIKFRDNLTDWNPPAVLSEVERGEDQIKQAYEEVLQDMPGSALNDVIQHQYSRVKSAHDRIRDLRDSYQGND
jgi:uncharacterized protein (TIGR02284 family)